jgi:hypothetical protein
LLFLRLLIFLFLLFLLPVLFYLAGRLRACGFALALLLSSVAGTCRRVVDDHASLPALARAALARPHGPIWSV